MGDEEVKKSKGTGNATHGEGKEATESTEGKEGTEEEESDDNNARPPKPSLWERRQNDQSENLPPRDDMTQATDDKRKKRRGFAPIGRFPAVLLDPINAQLLSPAASRTSAGGGCGGAEGGGDQLFGSPVLRRIRASRGKKGDSALLREALRKQREAEKKKKSELMLRTASMHAAHFKAAQTIGAAEPPPPPPPRQLMLQMGSPSASQVDQQRWFMEVNGFNRKLRPDRQLSYER